MRDNQYLCLERVLLFDLLPQVIQKGSIIEEELWRNKSLFWAALNENQRIRFLITKNQAFSFAVSPNAYRIAFIQWKEPVSEFRETNNTSGEILELKKGLPAECQAENLVQYYKNTSKFQQFDCHTLERSSI
ncbi:hypothetical protein DdX_20517 [Ditylenchus destructor]|uniref:Uncharacterized protein n=1 Tax=Ditylenchus destructor TaxID=166010 RepID=A0AAD4MGH3_9BILA|nr:hypothetical protein DdX_20517 [Ditylenchus destructor]